MTAVAIAAEQAGFESVWTGEHVVLPDPQVPPSPAAPLTNMVHPSTALSYIAAVTSKLKLGTGITLLAQRNALVLAKEMASLDFLSNGRLIFGIGAGYLKSEFDALGVKFSERGARTDEYIDAMREMWTSEQPSFSGQFVNFEGMQSRPQPVQKGGPEIVIGGNSAAAFRRAVTKCSGWYGFAMTNETAAQALAGIQAAADKYERPSDLGELEISITPIGRTASDDVERWTEMGVSRLILLQPGKDKESLLSYVDSVAKALL
jgi:probable F420-dependent oxidoreductase